MGTTKVEGSSTLKNKSPFLQFIPFLLLYIIFIVVFATNEFWGDEPRYLGFAENLTQGFYSPPPPDINITNGPGYPLVLVPFKALDLPLICFKLLNAVFLYLTLVFFFKTLLFYTKEKTARIATILFGCYYPLYLSLHLILTEILSVFLVTMIVYFSCSLFRDEHSKFTRILIPAFFLGYLALTKIIFGYVISVGIFIFAVIALLKKSRKARTMALVFLLALLFCVPYLIYTYNLTGIVFCWGAGEGLLYWMSTPYDGEYGDWHKRDLSEHPRLQANHAEFLDRVARLKPAQKKSAIKKQVIQNISGHPGKFFTNWLANWGRMFFSYPYSYQYQSIRTYFVIAPNMFIVVFIILGAMISVWNRRSIPEEIFMLLIFIAIYLFGSSLLSASRRMFFPALPVVGLWLAYLFDHFVQIRLLNAPT